MVFPYNIFVFSSITTQNTSYLISTSIAGIYTLQNFSDAIYGVEDDKRYVVAAIYYFVESDDEEQHIDYALRWQKSIGTWEVGLSWFDGTSREPELIAPDLTSDNPVVLPYYAQINQVGVDLLKVQGAWLLKFEGIYRTGQSEDFGAFVAGFERTSVGVFDTQYDPAFTGVFAGCFQVGGDVGDDLVVALVRRQFFAREDPYHGHSHVRKVIHPFPEIFHVAHVFR